MKKLSTILLILIVFTLTACSNVSKPNETQENIVNPIHEVESLEALSDEIDMAIYKYEGDNITDECYSYIDGDVKIAEYTFNDNNRKVTVRTSKAPCSVDISGIYWVDGTLYSSYLDEESSGYIENDEYFSHRWFTLDGQYVITTNVNEWDSFEFEALCKKMETIKPKGWNSSVAYEDYLNLCGYYMSEDNDIAAIIMEKDHVCVIVVLSKEDGNYTYEMSSVLDNNELIFDEVKVECNVFDSEKGETQTTELPSLGAGKIKVLDNQLSFEECNIEELSVVLMTKTEF